MLEINPKQRKFLEKSAHDLNPLVQIGGAGLTENQISQINRLLDEHELLKIKFNAFKDEKDSIAQAIEQKTESTIVRLIGNILVLYRPAKKTNDRKFESKLDELSK